MPGLAVMGKGGDSSIRSDEGLSRSYPYTDLCNRSQGTFNCEVNELIQR
jgi:hypothetical protein